MVKWMCVAMCAVAGCSMDIEVDDPGMYDCVDTRDGEMWSFDNRTAHDGWCDSSGCGVHVVDTEGKVRRITQEMTDTWLKCEGPMDERPSR